MIPADPDPPQELFDSSITFDQLAYTGYRYANLLQFEQVGLSPDQTEEARQTYNSMVNAWRADGLTVSHISREVFPIIPNKGDYTVGQGGDIDIPWQERIERAGILLTRECPEPEYPIWPLTVDEWQDWVLKKQATSYPRRFFYERKGPPFAILHLLYVPTDANGLVLYPEHYLVQVGATGNGTMWFQPGYLEAIETNLGRRLAMRVPGGSISQEVLTLARSSLALIKNANNRPLVRSSDVQQRTGRSDVYAGNRYGTIFSGGG